MTEGAGLKPGFAVALKWEIPPFAAQRMGHPAVLRAVPFAGGGFS
jgi:hypothetical protein